MASLTEIFTGESRSARARRIERERVAGENLTAAANLISRVRGERERLQGEEQAALQEQERISTLEGSASTILTSPEGVAEDPNIRRRRLRGVDSLAASDELLG